jgi:hypothetical protein
MRQKAWAHGSLGTSPEIFYKIFIMQMSCFGQMMPDVLGALCPAV